MTVFGQMVALYGETKDSTKKELTVADVTQKVEEAQAAFQDAQMDLQMEMKDSLSGTQQNSKGAVKMKFPDKIFVHYTQPTEQFLYIGGNLTQMYQPDQKTVYQQHNGKGKDAAPVYLGVGKQLKKYVEISKVTLFKNSDSEVGLLFEPKDKMTAGFDKMKVLIHKKDWWPYQIEMETPSMNSKAKFSNIFFNKGLKESLFEFAAPKGVQVVEGVVF
jgi:outer membrane lipoprotein-sorting protein